MLRRRLTRRQFLTQAGGGIASAAAPFVITSSALGGAGKAPAGERVALGQIGCGARGRALVGFFRPLPDAQFVAVCDPVAARREGLSRELRAAPHADLRDLLARDDVDAVIVATTDHWHVHAAVLAAKAGKDVYCEKPLALCLDWGLAARRAVRRYGRVFQYGTQALSYGHARRCCELVRSGAIGRIRRIEVSAVGGRAGGSEQPRPVPAGLDYDLWTGPAILKPFCGQAAAGQGDWIYDYDYSAGWLGGMGAHALAAMQLGFDSHLAGPCTIEATGTIPADGRNDTVTAWRSNIGFANGVEMSFDSGRQSTRFIGTDGWVAPPNVEYGLVAGQGGPFAAQPRSLVRWQPGPNDVRLPPDRGGHAADFLAAVKDRGPTAVGIDIAVWSEVFVHLADVAVRTRRRITWDPARERIVGDDEAARLLCRTPRQPWAL